MQLAQQDLSRITEILAEVARVEIMPRFKALADSDVRQKSSAFDPVTEADEAAERAISAQLHPGWLCCTKRRPVTARISTARATSQRTLLAV